MLLIDNQIKENLQNLPQERETSEVLIKHEIPRNKDMTEFYLLMNENINDRK